MKNPLFVFMIWILVQISAFSQGPYTITATAGTGGTITPSGAVSVTSGADQAFTIAANSDFFIQDVLIDGASIGATTSYTFPAVSADHTISAVFAVSPHLAINKPATAQSSEPSWPPNLAVDNDASNGSMWSSFPIPQWWKVDLEGFNTITRIVIRNYVDDVRYYQYNIETSTDDVTYTQVAAKTSTDLATDDGDTYTIASVNARFIRVNVTNNSSGVGAHITDFRVYGTPSATTYTITSSAGSGGTITPSGAVVVNEGADQTFDITPNPGYVVSDVLVDGGSVGALDTYTFPIVTATHTISASFSPVYTITATAGTGGTISPSGSVQLNPGSDQSFTIAPNTGFVIASVLVDGSPVGAVTSYDFTNVTADHTIIATFSVAPHLALNKPSYAKGSDSGHDPMFANDGDPSNNSYWADLSYPSWWKVDLEDIYNIDSIIIRNYVDGFRYYLYNIETSLDDVTYTQVIDKTSTDAATDEGDKYILSTPARYIRVNVTFNSANPGVHITDFRVYGTSTLTVTGVVANNKEYDMTTSVVLNTSGASLVGVEPGDVVTLVTTGATGAFADANAGTGKTVTTSGFTLSGADAGKYTLVQPTLTADITTKALTVTGLTADNKEYDSNTDATFSGTAGLSGILGSDVVTIGGTPVAAFTNANAGTGKTVNVTGYTLSGAQAGNYSLTLPVILTADITPKPVTVTASAGQTKTFSAADPTPFTYTFAPALLGSDVMSGALSRIAGENVGTYAYTLGTLTAGSNYNLSVAASPTFSITAKPIVITATAGQTKVYGQADPVFTYTNSPALQGGDSFTGSLGRAAGENIGNYAFTIGTLTAGSNYSLSVAATPTFSITAKPILVTATAGQTKTYGQADPIFTYTFSPALETGDSFAGTLGRVAGENVGTYAYILGTLSAGSNYNLSISPATSFGITAKPIIITANAGQTKVYGQSDPVFTYTNSPGLEGGDSFSGSLGRVAGENVGTYAFTLGTLTAGSNYTLSVLITPTFSITAKPIVITATAGLTKEYGQADPAFTYTYSPALEGSDSFSGSIGRVAGENVGTYAFTLGTLTAGTNYNLSVAATPTFSITTKAIVITATAGQTKVYGEADPAFTYTYSPDLESGDSFTGSIGRVTGENVGTYAFTLGTLTAGSNYSLSIAATPTFSITAKGIVITATAGQSKEYGQSDPVFMYTNNPALESGDSFSGALGRLAGENTGTYAYTLGTLSAGSNYSLSLAATPTFAITPKQLTISGITANNKIYDGTTAATLSGTAALVGIVGGDVVTIGGTPVANFASVNVANGIDVNVTGYTIGGAQAGNYSLIQPSLTADITARVLTIGGSFTVSNKVYDGTVSATISTNSLNLINKVGSDDVTLSATAVFANKLIGTGKLVSLTGSTLTGSTATNYTLSLTGAPTTTGNITSRIVTIGGAFTINNKVYDGTIDASIAINNLTLVTAAPGDDVSLVAVAIFSDKNIGSGKTVTLTSSSLSGSDASNYTLSFNGAPSSLADITSRLVTIGGTFTVSNKIYDGTAAATFLTNTLSLVTAAPGDDVSLSAVAVFSNKLIGTGKPVTLTGSTLTGSDATNYTLSFAGAPSTTGNISPRVLTIGGSFTVNDKEYDGNTSATITTNNLTLITVAGSDIVTLVPVATFSDAGIGLNKTVSLTGSSITGSDSPNYTLSLAGAPTTTASITEFALTVTGVTASDKAYDATTSAILNISSAVLVGVVSGDDVTLVSTGVTGAFVDKNAGTGKTVMVTGFTLSGTDAAKYMLIQPTTTADITPGTLTITGALANNKIYDGTTAATLNTSSAALVGIISGDIVSLNSTGATGTFSNKNVGTGKQVSTTGFTLGGIDAINYIISPPTLTANISVADLTILGVSAANKVYNGTTSATLNTSGASLSGVFGGDLVSLNTLGATGSFSDKNVGTDKTVNTSGFTLGGSGSGNYTLIQPTVTASITAKPLTVTADNLAKEYGTVLTFSGTEITTTGLVAGDAPPVVTLASAGSVAGADAGSYPITASGGTDLNYSYTYVAGVLTVTKAPLTASADDLTRYYGSPNPVLTITYTGFKNNDDASVLDILPTATTSALVTSDIGVYSIMLSGGSDNNYSLTLEDGSLEILKAPLTITADDKEKFYGEANPVLTISYSGFVLGQDQSILTVLPTVETAADMNSVAGSYDIDVYGAEAANYSFIYVTGVLTIRKADQTITFNAIPEGLRMTQEYTLEAMATSGLTVTFETSDPNKGTIEGNILTITGDGTFTVTAKQAGDDTWNAAEDVSQTIVTLPTFDNISSLFTPNGDGINDYWYIPDLEEYGAVEVTVYNRFGKSVYHSDSYMNDWDGTFNGYQLPSATYYYIIKSSTKGFIKGAVNIVR